MIEDNHQDKLEANNRDKQKLLFNIFIIELNIPISNTECLNI